MKEFLERFVTIFSLYFNTPVCDPFFVANFLWCVCAKSWLAVHKVIAIIERYIFKNHIIVVVIATDAGLMLQLRCQRYWATYVKEVLELDDFTITLVIDFLFLTSLLITLQ